MLEMEIPYSGTRALRLLSGAAIDDGKLVDEFRVPVPVSKTWDVLTDVERIAPCLPGAQLLSVDGEEFTGPSR